MIGVDLPSRFDDVVAIVEGPRRVDATVEQRATGPVVEQLRLDEVGEPVDVGADVDEHPADRADRRIELGADPEPGAVVDGCRLDVEVVESRLALPIRIRGRRDRFCDGRVRTRRRTTRPPSRGSKRGARARGFDGSRKFQRSKGLDGYGVAPWARWLRVAIRHRLSKGPVGPSRSSVSSHPVATPEQHEHERFAVELTRHATVRSAYERVKSHWLETADPTPGRDMLRCFEAAFEEVMFSAAVWSANQDPLRPRVIGDFGGWGGYGGYGDPYYGQGGWGGYGGQGGWGYGQEADMALVARPLAAVAVPAEHPEVEARLAVEAKGKSPTRMLLIE